MVLQARFVTFNNLTTTNTQKTCLKITIHNPNRKFPEKMLPTPASSTGPVLTSSVDKDNPVFKLREFHKLFVVFMLRNTLVLFATKSIRSGSIVFPPKKEEESNVYFKLNLTSPTVKAFAIEVCETITRKLLLGEEKNIEEETKLIPGTGICLLKYFLYATQTVLNCLTPPDMSYSINIDIARRITDDPHDENALKEMNTAFIEQTQMAYKRLDVTETVSGLRSCNIHCTCRLSSIRLELKQLNPAQLGHIFCFNPNQEAHEDKPKTLEYSPDVSLDGYVQSMTHMITGNTYMSSAGRSMVHSLGRDRGDSRDSGISGYMATEEQTAHADQNDYLDPDGEFSPGALDDSYNFFKYYNMIQNPSLNQKIDE